MDEKLKKLIETQVEFWTEALGDEGEDLKKKTPANFSNYTPLHGSGGIFTELTWMTIAARNLCLAEEKGLDIITLCNGCVNTLGQARRALAHTPRN